MRLKTVISKMSKNFAMNHALATAIGKFKIVNVDHFLGQMMWESARLTKLRESLNYGTNALVASFGRHRISLEDAERYGRNEDHAANQERLANILYGGKFGRDNLGNTQPNDGWHFRGVGVPQLTGRANITAFAKYVGRDPELRLDPNIIASTPQLAADAAGWYWAVLKPQLNRPGLTVERVTELVTGSPSQAIRSRRDLTNEARRLLDSAEI